MKATVTRKDDIVHTVFVVQLILGHAILAHAV
jgi:hypothetical protein